MQSRPKRAVLAHRLAVATAVCAVPLLLFGGSVTTLGAGMAVEGWLVAEGHFLLVFPVEKWFRDVPTFVEHTHRLFGALVGMFAIATVVAARGAARHDATRSSAVGRRLAWASLVAVCAQGALGGFRVLENSASLAFLHGAIAQLVFALLCLSAVHLRPSAAAERARGESPATSTLRRWALAASALVFAQIVLGAWYRHGLRPEPIADLGARLTLHLVGGFVVLFALHGLGKRLDPRGAEPGAFPGARRRLAGLVGVQVALGMLAWAGYRPGGVAPLEWALSILHVLCGALLLAQCIVLALGTGAFSNHVRVATRVERLGGTP